MNEHLQAWRAALLWFDADGRALYEQDGLLVTQREPDGIHRVHAIGDYQALKSQFQQLKPTHWPDRLIAPGFVDMHIHKTGCYQTIWTMRTRFCGYAHSLPTIGCDWLASRGLVALADAIHLCARGQIF